MGLPNFCEECSSPFRQSEKKLTGMECGQCGHQRFFNPVPVVNAIVPIMYANDDGTMATRFLVIERGIQPYRGELAFPGGYMDLGETWQGTALRELQEEIGLFDHIELASPIAEDDLRLAGIKTVIREGHSILVLFALFPSIMVSHDQRDAITKVSGPEVLRVHLVKEGETLGIPIHDEMMQELEI